MLAHAQWEQVTMGVSAGWRGWLDVALPSFLYLWGCGDMVKPQDGHTNRKLKGSGQVE